MASHSASRTSCGAGYILFNWKCPEIGRTTTGAHAFRRFRDTYLKNYTSTPPGMRNLEETHCSAKCIVRFTEQLFVSQGDDWIDARGAVSPWVWGCASAAASSTEEYSRSFASET
jgi:hypothetical protein